MQEPHTTSQIYNPNPFVEVYNILTAHRANLQVIACKFSNLLCKIDASFTFLLEYGGIMTLFVSRLSVTLSCPLDLALFPMDTQRCKMQLESCE